MKFTRVATLCFAALMIFTVLSGCTAATAYQKSIYNDDSKIVKQADSFNFKTRIGNTTDKESSVKFGTFYGMETIWFVESEGNGTITFQYSSKVDKRKFKCVLITPKDKVIDVFEQSGEGEKSLDIPEGKNRIKIIGNNASGEIKLEIAADGDCVVKNVELNNFGSIYQKAFQQ